MVYYFLAVALLPFVKIYFMVAEYFQSLQDIAERFATHKLYPWQADKLAEILEAEVSAHLEKIMKDVSDDKD